MQPIFFKELRRPAQVIWTPVFQRFDEFFNDLSSSSAKPSAEYSPAYDIQETDEQYLLTFDVPGVDRDDIGVELCGSKLAVSGMRKVGGVAEKRDRRYGKFQHVFTVPEGVTAEAVEAQYKDGVLALTVKKPATARPSKIKINDGTASNKQEQAAIAS